MTPPRIYLSPPHITGNELKYVKEAFDSNWVAPLGPHVDAFEQELADFTGVKQAAVLSSGTAAMHLALILLGVKNGDEVICQSFTFCGSVNPVVYMGGVPVLIDSERDTWNMDPELLETAIRERVKKGKKPRAIIYVHLYGTPAKISDLSAIGKKYDIPLIEDAAEALGSEYNGAKTGSYGDLSIYSFNGNKIITTSGGGALLSNSTDFIEKARFLATQARDKAPHYQHSEIGYNYRMSNVAAGIGRGQLEEIHKKINRRREIQAYYKENLKDIPGIYFHEEPFHVRSNRWLTCILVDPEKTGGKGREDIRQFLEKENIESRPLWKPMHLQPVYQDAPFYGATISEKLFDQGLCLPSGTALVTSDLERICSIIKKGLSI